MYVYFVSQIRPTYLQELGYKKRMKQRSTYFIHRKISR